MNTNLNTPDDNDLFLPMLTCTGLGFAAAGGYRLWRVGRQARSIAESINRDPWKSRGGSTIIAVDREHFIFERIARREIRFHPWTNKAEEVLVAERTNLIELITPNIVKGNPRVVLSENFRWSATLPGGLRDSRFITTRGEASQGVRQAGEANQYYLYGQMQGDYLYGQMRKEYFVAEVASDDLATLVNELTEDHSIKWFLAMATILIILGILVDTDEQ